MRQVFTLLCVLVAFHLQAQKLLEDEKALQMVKEGTDFIYNQQYGQAEKHIEKIGQKYKNHPVYPMMKAMNIYWKNIPVDAENKHYHVIKQYLSSTIELADQLLKKDKNDIEGIFFALIAHASNAQFYSEEEKYLKAINEAKKAYTYIKKGFDLTDESPEFYFSTGLYNFYREQYPETKPIYKSLVWIFPSGDKELGIEQLELATRKAIFTKAEASSWLTHIQLRYMDKPEEAIRHAKTLLEQYPNNLHFKKNYTETLIAVQNYKEAQPFINDLMDSPGDFYQMVAKVFKGICTEKKQKDYTKAKKIYETALEESEKLGKVTNNYKSYAYAGLARIADKQGDTEKAREHYKKALELAEYKIIKQEAKEYLD